MGWLVHYLNQLKGIALPLIIGFKLGELKGLEPSTTAFGAVRSNHLAYSSNWF